MNQQGGLDTLAALCGGASMASTTPALPHDSAPSDVGSATDSGPSTVNLPTTANTGQHLDKPNLQQPSATQTTISPSDPSASTWHPLTSAYAAIPNPAVTAAFASAIQAAMQNPSAFQPSVSDANTFNAMHQQVAYYQFMAAAQAQAAQQQVNVGPPAQSTSHPAFAVMDPGSAGAFTFQGHTSPQFHFVADAGKRMNAPQQASRQVQVAASSMQQIIPGPSTPSPAQKPESSGQSSMQPPPPPSQVSSVSSTLSTNTIIASSPQRPLAPTTSKIMPMNPPQTSIAQRPTVENTPTIAPPRDEKKQQKRAANRRSAQLSRKRKKLFIEELKEENDELRRKEQILKSIPDLIVVFDSAGKLWFVSHSISRFLDFVPQELEGSSFWNRLCEESVRLLKAAFMDALAARKSNMDTAPLGSGVWELRLVDKDGTHKIVTLNGVVHFSGDHPECVCSIRPRDDKINPAKPSELSAAIQATRRLSVTVQNTIKPHQSVMAGVKDDASVRLVQGIGQDPKEGVAAGNNGRRAAQISDGDSGSVISESSSE